ncbi:unnamed protein product [Rotaria sordida]|uniref:Uncharacterized protein n=1 Tax=Rotaria sordida TaxID=392033 RepID=A0A818ZT10_9BILA|nr:unnamed protein product [Rotaria sordida]CAF1318461.1 unnamed protein product [Rotaria sordida]CAF1335058.1 unnamed protein product [Rotaria sordida]CAF3729863.1 unnamed protein product [Rotaria sordida]CAF3762436.1 unnamed protein product [Rotaria sordida]
MNKSYALIFFALIILFSSSSVTCQIYSNSYKHGQENVRSINMKMSVPIKDDSLGLKYFILPINHVSDGRMRRGWGSGRRRQSISNDS